MEYQKAMNLSDNSQNEPFRFRTRNWVKIYDESRGTYKGSNQIKFKTSMIRSNLGDYSDAYVLVSGTIAIIGGGDNDITKRADEKNKGVIFKKFSSFTGCKSNIKNTQIDNAKDIDVVMQMYNLIEYSDNYSKTSGILWHYYRNDPNSNIVNSESFKSKIKAIRNTPFKDNKKCWRTLEILLINCKTNLILSWSENCVISSGTGIKNLQ